MVVTTEKAGGLISPALSKKRIKMKYIILVDTVANGKKVKAGDIVELPSDVGSSLIGYKKADVYTETKEKKVVDRSVGLKKSEKKLSKRK